MVWLNHNTLSMMMVFASAAAIGYHKNYINRFENRDILLKFSEWRKSIQKLIEQWNTVKSPKPSQNRNGKFKFYHDELSINNMCSIQWMKRMRYIACKHVNRTHWSNTKRTCAPRSLLFTQYRIRDQLIRRCRIVCLDKVGR